MDYTVYTCITYLLSKRQAVFRYLLCAFVSMALCVIAKYKTTGDRPTETIIFLPMVTQAASKSCR